MLPGAVPGAKANREAAQRDIRPHSISIQPPCSEANGTDTSPRLPAPEPNVGISEFQPTRRARTQPPRRSTTSILLASEPPSNQNQRRAYPREAAESQSFRGLICCTFASNIGDMQRKLTAAGNKLHLIASDNVYYVMGEWRLVDALCKPYHLIHEH
jgi:hypothetical protein